MNNLLKLFVTLCLILTLTVALAGCKYLIPQEDQQDQTDNDGGDELTPPAEDDGENGSTDSDGTGGSSENGNGNADNGKDEDADKNEDENKDETDLPTEEDKEDDSPYIEDTSLPHFDYSSTSSGKYNTSLFYANDYDISLGDPTVFYREEASGGWFYVTGTTIGQDFDLWKTKNFTDWGYVGKIYTPPTNFFGENCFWAPQISYDAEASHSYYLGEGDGKGLYILAFSSRASDNTYRLAIAFSKNIEGPYKHFEGTNANGDYIDASTSCFEISKLKGLGLYSNHVYGDLYKARRGFIDASPYVDPVSGDKYLYMVRNRSVDTSNDVWGVKMKDWVSPDYSTTTPLSSYGYTTIDKNEKLNFTTKNKIDEGPFLYYKDNSNDGIDNGKYYLTLSIGDTNDKLYPVCQAVGDSPLGPFTKIQPEDLGFVVTPGDLWDIHSSGHHCFFEAGGELFVAYHTYTINKDTTAIRRYFGMAEVKWVYNDDGQYVMRANGPSKDIQPLPEVSSDYKNIVGNATVKAEGSNIKNTESLTDGLISLRDGDGTTEFEFSDKATITLDFKDYITARAIMIYNSYDYAHSFDKIDKIEFSYRKIIGGKYYYGTAYIEDLGFDMSSHLIPQYYLLTNGQTNMNQLRPTGAAIAEFYELEINSIKISVTAPARTQTCRIGEITVLGTEKAANLSFGISKDTPFLNYNGFSVSNLNVSVDSTVTLDGVLDENIWKNPHSKHEIAGVETDATTKEPVDVSKYGKREADVYSYIGDKYVYFAIDVKDKNLFYHSWLPQGRSTAVELYISSSSSTGMDTSCYSIRINPIDDGTFRLGIYAPNANKNEWAAVEENLFGSVRVGLKVNGEIKSSAPGSDYDRSKNIGYTVEIAIDKMLFMGLDIDSFKFTAAFVQMKEYNQARMGNSFIDGTLYVDVSSWKLVTKKTI